MNFQTKQINIETIVSEKLEFLIPVYQRPYVWGDIEINKLLEDLISNYKSNPENEYFVGNTYVIKSKKGNKENQFEVIDGQQRFTTFWLISLCFNSLKIDTELQKYLQIEFENYKDIRFDFDIRKEVYEYLKSLLDGTAERRFQDVRNFEFLKNIAQGLKTVEGVLTQNKEINNDVNFERIDLISFGNYIYKNVKFVFNEAPENTDLNALFVALGTSGMQLQQSDILKARLLDKITEKNQRILYSKIWEACENMNNYFESNVKLSFPYDTSNIVEADFKKFNLEKFNYKSEHIENDYKGITVQEITKLDNDLSEENSKEGYINTECRSIISFNVFLFHTLRIYRKKNNINTDIDSLDPKKLLQSFKINEVDNVQEFFELMWKLRYVFDKYIVKWLKDEDESIDDEEKLLLSSIITKKSEDKLKSYFSRKEKSFSDLQMLQSILYFTGIFTQQYWLTPFLSFLLENENLYDQEDFDKIILRELERIDNIMIPGDKKEISWRILNKTELNQDLESIKSTLNSSSGVSFNHYWFYKLEYLLWKKWDKNDDKLKRYRITSKNSVEHIFPQNQEYKIQLKDLQDNIDWLNSFGNLALLSVGQNSEYSNHSFIIKKDRFIAKDTYDSLKSAKIFQNVNWNSEEIIIHNEEMITILENHYK